MGARPCLLFGDEADRDGKRASPFMPGATTTSGLARELGSRDGSAVTIPEVKRLGLVPRTEELRNG